MEGLLDFSLRDVLTRVGGIDRCVSEFIRVTDQLLPDRVFTRIVPELRHGGRTPAGVPVRAQLLGSDPACLADNAAALARLQPAGIDLNFGCPAKTMNRHRGGAVLLDEPELVHAIVAAVCRAESGCHALMLGRGMVVDPGLALAIGAPQRAAVGWSQLKPLLAYYWQLIAGHCAPRHRAGRLKQWLNLLRRRYPQAQALFDTLRLVNDPAQVELQLN